MKILIIKDVTFTFDDEDFEKIKHRKFTVDSRRGHLLRFSDTGKAVHKELFPEFTRVKTVNGDWTDLRKENLIEFKKNPNQRKEWYEKNFEKIRTRASDWQKENKTKVNKTRKQWKENNPEKNKENLKKRYIRIGFKYSNLKNSAKRRGLNLEITREQYEEIIKAGCFYTGENLTDTNYSGHCLDRIDNTKGYTVDNVLPCIGWVNQMRQNHLTVEETKVAVDAILKYRKQKLDNQS